VAVTPVVADWALIESIKPLKVAAGCGGGDRGFAVVIPNE
jgi:hypothetical protein